ncbi:hypothetical protein FC35_GL000916 [Limosilactobacillus coleohominis DSM 14060]|nr:hypothetical protein FC35_GL000916 [Limosilactobacillus coleohominis DSM 14060]
MRYDQTVYLIKEIPPSDDEMNYRPKIVTNAIKANVKRTNLTFGNGSMYDVTIVRVFGEVDADKIGLDDYDPKDRSTIHQIQKVGRHFQRTDFYIVNSEVVFNHG